VQSAYKEANQLMAIFLKSIETAKPVRLASAGRSKIKLFQLSYSPSDRVIPVRTGTGGRAGLFFISYFMIEI
jgi:hypothetical protein